MRKVPLIAILACEALLPGTARADGCLLGSVHADVYEPAQRALIVHDPDAAREDLYIQGDYEGTTDTFAWIVPVPALPSIETANPALFRECADLTRTLVEERDGFGCYHSDTKYGAPQLDNGVDVYAHDRVGIYDTMVLGASEASVLADSLDSWSYLHVRNRETVLATLQFYIDKEWYFVAMRTDPSRLDDPDREGPRYGGMDPIRLSFSSARTVYPMRISAVSASPWSSLLLYVAAPHRMEFPGARAEYANRVTSRELEAIRSKYPAVGAALGGPCFLTKLRRGFAPTDMTDDLTLEQAPSDAEFRRIQYGSVPMAELLFVAMGLGMRRIARRRNGGTGRGARRPLGSGRGTMRPTATG